MEVIQTLCLGMLTAGTRTRTCTFTTKKSAFEYKSMSTSCIESKQVGRCSLYATEV